MIINPYNGIDLDSKTHVMSFSHGHCSNQTHFDNYVTAGYRHIPVSNYHPSKPIGAEQFNTYADANGTSGLIYSPNMELGYSSVGHSGTFSYYTHYCCPGSTYESGTDDEEVANRWTWQTQFTKMLNGLVYPDGGGITLNHPGWTLNNYTGYESMDEDKLFNWFCAMLDWDERVLGVEIINGGGYRYDYGSHDVTFWDRILLTGRRCFCFCTPDWDVSLRYANCKGRNMLLVDSATEHDCLKSYRNGHFYGKSGTTNLTLSKAEFNESTRQYSVVMPNAERVALVVDGEYTYYDSDRFTATIPAGSIYCRAEGYKADSSDTETGKDEVYTQAVMLRPRARPDRKFDLLIAK